MVPEVPMVLRRRCTLGTLGTLGTPGTQIKT